MKKQLLFLFACVSLGAFAQKGDQPNGNQVNEAASGAVQLENDGLRKFGTSVPLRFYTPSSNSPKFEFFDDGIINIWDLARLEGFGFGVNAEGRMEFLSNGSSSFGTSNSRMVIDDDNGNVGIGVLNPLAQLDIIGGDWNLAGVSNGDLRIGNDTYNLRVGVSTAGGGAGDIRMFAKGGTGRLIWGSGTSDLMAMTSLGQLGIGTLSPVGKFQIDHGGNDSDPHINIRATGAQSRINWTTDDNTKKWIAQSFLNSATDASNYLRFEYFNGTSTDSFVLNMTGNGNVGIGEVTPDTRLHVKGSENDGTTASLKITSGSQNMLIDGNEIDVTQTGLYLNNNTNLNVILATGGGNVGIGTASPDNKLDVLGIIRANEVIVETGWADYVFADDYQLDDLSKVETFIRENKHLPNVPSAAEIQDKGAHVSALMTKMMEKIEELTLYTIKQQKEIDALKVQLQNK